MEKALTSLLLIFMVLNSYSQVGIGTTTPKRELHIANKNSGIRIDGLNNINQNTKSNSKALYANKDGVLVTTDEVNIIYEFKADGININPYFQEESITITPDIEKTIKKIGNPIKFVNEVDGILFISFQPKLSLKNTPEETFNNLSARNFGIEMIIKDANGKIWHKVTKQTGHHKSAISAFINEKCIEDNENDPDFDVMNCVTDFFKTIDLNLNLSTTAFIGPGNYTIEFYGFGYRSNDLISSGSSSGIDINTIPYVVTYEHDIHSEMNVYVIHP